jgi:hypothetical protein
MQSMLGLYLHTFLKITGGRQPHLLNGLIGSGIGRKVGEAGGHYRDTVRPILREGPGRTNRPPSRDVESCRMRCRLQLFRAREQNRGFCCGDPFDQPDLVQRRTEIRQGCGVDLGDQIPSAVGGVDPFHLREPVQRLDHLAGLLSLDRDGHHRPDTARLQFGRGANREAADGAGGEHPRDTVLNCPA